MPTRAGSRTIRSTFFLRTSTTAFTSSMVLYTWNEILKPSCRFDATIPLSDSFCTIKVESLHCKTTNGPALSAGVLARMPRSRALLNSDCASLSMWAATFSTPISFSNWNPGTAAYTLGTDGEPDSNLRALVDKSMCWGSKSNGLVCANHPVTVGTSDEMSSLRTYMKASPGGPSRYLRVPVTKKSTSMALTSTGRVPQSW